VCLRRAVSERAVRECGEAREPSALGAEPEGAGKRGQARVRWTWRLREHRREQNYKISVFERADISAAMRAQVSRVGALLSLAVMM
jgi:hypothetical protein